MVLLGDVILGCCRELFLQGFDLGHQVELFVSAFQVRFAVVHELSKGRGHLLGVCSLSFPCFCHPANFGAGNWHVRILMGDVGFDAMLLEELVHGWRPEFLVGVITHNVVH